MSLKAVERRAGSKSGFYSTLILFALMIKLNCLGAFLYYSVNLLKFDLKAPFWSLRVDLFGTPNPAGSI